MLWPCHAGQGGGCTRSTVWVDYASPAVNFQYNSKDYKNTMHVYLVTYGCMLTHVIALEARQSSQGALKPITPVQLITNIVIYFQKDTLSFYHLTCICHPACIFHQPWARYDPRAPPPHILANLYFFEPLGCPEYEIGL